MAKFQTFTYGSSVLYGLYPVIDLINPTSGPVSGGQPFVIRGDGFDYDDFNDDFTAGVLNLAKWLDISSGTGTVATGSSHLQLNTGATAGSVAGVESLRPFVNAQYEARVNVPTISAYPTSSVELVKLSLYIDANNHADLTINLGTSSSDLTLDCDIYVGGVLLETYSTSWTTGLSTFKLLRWTSDVYFYANGSLIFKSEKFTATTGTYRVYSYNGGAAYSIVNTVVESMNYVPFVVFDNAVVHDLLVVSNQRARGLTPPSLDKKDRSEGYAGLVDVSIVGGITVTTADLYTYYYEDVLTLMDNEQFGVKLSDITDSTVRTPTNVSRGLGGGK